MTNAESAEFAKKTDAELDTIIDSLSANAPLRKPALEERHKRQRERDEKVQRTQEAIRSMTRIILWITAITGIVAVATLVGTLVK